MLKPGHQARSPPGDPERWEVDAWAIPGFHSEISVKCVVRGGQEKRNQRENVLSATALWQRRGPMAALRVEWRHGSALVLGLWRCWCQACVHFPTGQSCDVMPSRSLPWRLCVPTTGLQDTGLSCSWAWGRAAPGHCAIRETAEGTQSQELARSSFIHFSQGSECYHWILQVQNYVCVETGLFWLPCSAKNVLLGQGFAPMYISKGWTKQDTVEQQQRAASSLQLCLTSPFGRSVSYVLALHWPWMALPSQPLQPLPHLGSREGASLSSLPEKGSGRMERKGYCRWDPLWEELSSSPVLWACTDFTCGSRNPTEQIRSCRNGVAQLPLKVCCLSQTWRWHENLPKGGCGP